MATINYYYTGACPLSPHQCVPHPPATKNAECDAVRHSCIVVQCGAVCCNVWQSAAACCVRCGVCVVCCILLLCVAGVAARFAFLHHAKAVGIYESASIRMQCSAQQHNAVCYVVLQFGAICCNAMRCVVLVYMRQTPPECASVFQSVCTQVWCSVLRCVAEWCSVV